MSKSVHPYIKCIDPPGHDNRRWQCQACDRVGTLAELRANPCGIPATDDDIIHALSAEGEKGEG